MGGEKMEDVTREVEELKQKVEALRKAVLKLLSWEHYIMRCLAKGEPEVHDDIDELEKLLGKKDTEVKAG